MKTIEERLVRLERSNQQWKCCAVMMGVLCVAVLFAGAGEKVTPIETIRCKEIETESITIKKNGDILGSFGAGFAEGSCSLTLFTPTGPDRSHITCSLTSQEKEGSLLFFGPNLQPTIKILGQSESPSISVSKRDKNGVGVGGWAYLGYRNDQMAFHIEDNLKKVTLP